MEGRRERKARLEEESEQRVALAARYKGMSLAERVAEARREDLTEDEQLALATFANDPEVEEALLTNRNLESAPQFIAEAVAREHRRSALPWWRRIWMRSPRCPERADPALQDGRGTDGTGIMRSWQNQVVAVFITLPSL